jgi:hypothetical protein
MITRIRNQIKTVGFIWIFLSLVACSLLSPGDETRPQAINQLFTAIPTQELAYKTPVPIWLPSPTLAFSTPEATSTRPIELNPLYTPVPSATLTATPTLTPQAVHWSSDLLFLSGDRLMRWDPVTYSVTTLVEQVMAYTVSANGKKAVVMQPLKITANSNELFNLSVIDLTTNQISLLVKRTSLLDGISISPDGRWVAYLFPHINPTETLTIYITASNGTTLPMAAGACEPETPLICQTTTWSQDSQSVLWSDQRGIWLVDVNSSNPIQVISNRVTVVDPKGQISEMVVYYHGIQWRPGGRYLLATVTPSSSNTHWQAIIDTRTTRISEIPDTFNSTDHAVSAQWLWDGSLVVSHTGSSDPANLPYLTVWQPSPTRANLLTVLQTIQVGMDNLPTPANPTPVFPFAPFASSFFTGNESTVYTPNWIVQFDAIYLYIVMTNPSANTHWYLLSYDLRQNIFLKIGQIQPDTSEVKWSPDRRGALVIQEQNHPYYVPLDGSPATDLQPVMGNQTHDYYWLPPTPRS